MTGLGCGHEFCSKCWTEYLTTKITGEDGAGGAGAIECPGAKCDILVDDATVADLIKKPAVMRKFQQLIASSFVQCNSLMRWCPSPDCSRAVKVAHAEAKPVKCACAHSFCFACAHDWHGPVTCDLLRAWIKKCNDESETSHWILANTKECPKCHATIEKNGGCNHMTCRNNACRNEFCWVCLGSWREHQQAYNCNRFNDAKAKDARDKLEVSRAALARYLFYVERYANHQKSLKFESRLYDKVEEKMSELIRLMKSWVDAQFLRKAVDVLCECRRTLMYTYVFAFYLKKNNQSEIFEDNQKDLERSTEELSGLLEGEISEENFTTFCQKVIDKSKYCDSRRQVLTAHVHEGYEKDTWVYA